MARHKAKVPLGSIYIIYIGCAVRLYRTAREGSGNFFARSRKILGSVYDGGCIWGK